MAKDDYSGIDNGEKNVKAQSGLFSFPADIQGKTDNGLRKFLIFYFDDEKDYDLVLSKLSKSNPHVKSHPDMNSVALAELIRKADK